MAGTREVAYHEAMRYLLLLSLLLTFACEKEKTTGGDPDSKLLGERLIAEHGAAVLESPILVVYDDGYLVGRGSVDPDFGKKIDALGLDLKTSLSSGPDPIDAREYYGSEGVEFGVLPAEKSVVVDASSSLTIRLAFGDAGIKALRACEEIELDRVCKMDGEVRAFLNDAPVTGGLLLESGTEVARGSVTRDWLVFPGAPDPSDDAQLELFLGDGVRCNLSKWLVDPRDSCAM